MASRSRKVASRSDRPVGYANEIPTTIKNPERVASRRSELIEVSTNLFLERGFHNTSIRDIVRVWSSNVASLYMYVSSKEDILYLVAQDLMTTIADELSATKLDANSAERSLALGFSAYCHIADKFRRQIRLLYREVGFLPSKPRAAVLGTVSDVVSFFERIVETGVASGEFQEVTPRIVALNMMMIAHMLALHTREVLSVTELDDFIDQQLSTVFAGLLVERGGGGRKKRPAKAKPTRD